VIDKQAPTGQEPIRLSKLMSQRGLCSRREADKLIEKGWVLVDGQAVTTLGTKVSPTANVELSDKAKAQQRERVTIMLNKPVGYVSAQVDIDSQGLLVLTQDGRIAKQLIGEHSDLEKEYLVRVRGDISEAQIKSLQFGLKLDGKALKRAKVKQLNTEQLQIILREGKKRQIRRMCEAVGLHVTGLKRVRVGELRLGKLAEGEWRFVKAEEFRHRRPKSQHKRARTSSTASNHQKRSR